MAGLYPDSYDVKQLSEILYNKVNPIKKTNRWKYNHPEVAQYNGNIPDLQYFDAQFFKVHYRLCNNMDPMSRKILEQAYQAIYDAGLSPEHLSGKKVGVYIGTCFSETEKACFYVASSRTGFGIAGCNKSMFANRISYWLNAKGPSMSIDEACCSSTAALELAYTAIARGDCEAAIVGGTNVCLHPQASVHYGRIMKLSKDGKTKSFDMNASGCARSEAVNVLFLQKAKDALRIYAYVVHAKSEFTALAETETGPKYGFYRNPKDMTKFLNTFYNEANISPNAVKYVEAFGSAVPEADKSELEAIDEVFCKSRDKPLLVGSVMSNIGYGEAASGISAVTKVLLGYYSGKLASNLHYGKPRIDLPAIKDGRIEILDENKEFDRTYAAVNSMSITGVNAHVLLHGYRKPKDINRYKTSIPRLVLLSGRQESSVRKIIQDLKSRPIDPEEHALLHNIHETRISGHLGRGFVILDTNESNETESLCEVSDYFDQGKRPLWFVYSGMGSQWAGMGSELMRIPIFAAAIERCHRVLEPKGVNIVEIITSENKKMFDNILHSFVGIAAIQIGLTDILRELEIFPDHIIGHSLGEIGCAYADGCFTIEETILCAYSRGLVSIQTPFIRGSMAAVGLGYREISKLCPPEVEVACHNSPDSSTISGPAEVMSEFVASLTNKGIFAKEVPCSNIAYHSRYIADAGPGLLHYMKELIKTPKLRSERWLSTSVPQDKWDQTSAKYCSAEYHTNNLLNSVLFEETSRLIPPDAVLIEVAPHGLLQAILKRSLPQSCRLLPLTRRAHPDCVRFLLEAIGRLSMEGFQPKVKALYPKVEFPVSTSTPMLSHLVEWAHNEKWNLPLYASANRKSASACKYVISTHDDEHSYLKGYVIRGKNQYPFAASLVAVWDTLAMTLNLKLKSVSVQFRDVFLHSQPLLHEQRQLRIDISLQRGTGRFEVMNGNSLMIHGFITTNVITNKRYAVMTSQTNVSAQDVYQLFCARDYNYGQAFRSIHSVNESMTEALIEWKHNWVTFIDGLLQLNILKRNHNGVSKLASIRNVVIDVDRQANETVNMDGITLLNANLLETYNSSVCGGVIVENITFVDLPTIREDRIILNTPKYIPFFPENVTDETTALYLFLQVVSDNIKTKEINILEVVDTESHKSEFNSITDVIYNIPGVKAQYTIVDKRNIFGDENILLRHCNLLLVSKLYTDANLSETLARVLHHDTFLINKQTSNITKSQRPALYHVVSEHNVGEAKLELAIWSHRKPNCASMLAIRSPKNVSALSITEKFGGEYYLPCDNIIGNTERAAMLKIERVGDLNSLKWVKAMPNHDSCCGLEVQVNYAGLNMVGLNKYLETSLYDDGDESKSIIDFSGLTKSGARVMGLVQTDAIASRLKANSEFLWPVPAHWSAEDAATVPLAYSLAFYILFIKAQLSSHYKVCVQGGTGALGQAIISIALAHDCEVFTTVSNNAKRQFVRKLFPELKDDHIGNSRDISFADTVLATTKGKGCHIVICCSKGELKDVSFKCCGQMGVLFDTTLVPNHEDYKFGMNHLKEERAYITVDLASVFQPKYYKDAKDLHILMSEGIARGYVRPLSRVTSGPQDATRAFRLQAACSSRGRVLLDLRQIASNVLPRLTCSSSSWQLLISDNEVLALKLAERLIKEGAKKIVLLLNNPSNYVHLQLRYWREVGVEMKILGNDIWKQTTITNVVQDCERESSLESLLIISKKAENVTELVENCRRIVQKTCISLKYFSVISPINITDKNTLESGLQSINLPETILNTRNDDIISGHNYLSINYIIDTLEKALCSKHKTILAHMSTGPRVPLWQQLLKFADIRNEILLRNASDDVNLKDLTKDYAQLISIQGYLRDVCDICLNVEEIEMLSIQSINQLEKEIMGYKFEESQGIGSYFSNVDTDDLLSTTEMVFLPTLTTSSSMRDDEFDVTQTYLCIVPGVEGLHSRFHRMCEGLKLPAVVLQPGFNWPNETVSEMAHRYAQILLTKTELKKKFYLLGYESGVLVALEMAAILEENGLTGTVYCIGGSPAEILADFKHNLRDLQTSEQLQTAVLKHMYTLMTNEDTEILNSFMYSNWDWRHKVNACVQTLLGKIQNPIQYAKELIETAYARLWLLLQYTPRTKKLRSQLISLRPKYSTSVDSSLKSFSHQETISYQLQTPLSFTTQDLMCTAIINRHLDADILENFTSKNLCESYIENANSFMTIYAD